MKKIARKILENTFDGLIFIESIFHKKQPLFESDGSRKKRVLIIRKDELGDCIIFYPTLRAYREYYKDAEITLVFPKHFESLSPILSKDLVDKIVWFDGAMFKLDLRYRRRFLLDLAAMDYDILIHPVFSREQIGHFMMKMTGASETIGFDGGLSEHGKKAEKRGTLKYTRLIRPPDDMILETDRDAYFAGKITGQPVHISFPTIDVNKLPYEKTKKLMRDYDFIEKKYVVIFPGAGIHFRIWMAENFANIIDYLADKGFVLVVCGGPKEISLTGRILRLVKPTLVSNGSVIDLAGKTDLSAMAHLLTKSQFYFGSETGILHLAVAVGCPTVAIVGSGGLKRFFPYGDPAKNMAVYDKTRSYKYGDWSDAIPLVSKKDAIHSSISNITVADAKKEIDYMIDYISS